MRGRGNRGKAIEVYTRTRRGGSLSGAVRRLDYNNEEDGTPRQTKRRGIDISSRRQRVCEQQDTVPDIQESRTFEEADYEVQGTDDVNDTQADFDDEESASVSVSIETEDDDEEEIEAEDDDEEIEAMDDPDRDAGAETCDVIGSSSGVGARQAIYRKGGRFAANPDAVRRPRLTDDKTWLVTGPIEGGPENGSVIPSFLGHVASTYWSGIEERRGVLTCHSRRVMCSKLIQFYQNATPEMKQMVDETGLSHLPALMFEHVDQPLVSAFVERWQPDTNSFHMPFGEISLTLYDVWMILRIPVQGELVRAAPNAGRVAALCTAFFECDATDMKGYYHKGGVFNSKLKEIMADPEQFTDKRAEVWVWLTLGSTLFVDKSGDKTKPQFLEEMIDGTEGVAKYSWASATLAYLYRQLGLASRGETLGIGGCMTLLMTWIYEYFPSLRPSRIARRTDRNAARASKWDVGRPGQKATRLAEIRAQLDRFTTADVMWLPFGRIPNCPELRLPYCGWILYREVSEPYMPDRCVRQLGFVQPVPVDILRPISAFRPWRPTAYHVVYPASLVQDWWQRNPHGIDPNMLQKAAGSDPGACTQDYMQWFCRVSHPILSSAIMVEPTTYPRANSAYWVQRFAGVAQRSIGDIESEARRKERTTDLEMALRDWHESV